MRCSKKCGCRRNGKAKWWVFYSFSFLYSKMWCDGIWGHSSQCLKNNSTSLITHLCERSEQILFWIFWLKSANSTDATLTIFGAKNQIFSNETFWAIFIHCDWMSRRKSTKGILNMNLSLNSSAEYIFSEGQFQSTQWPKILQKGFILLYCQMK